MKLTSSPFSRYYIASASTQITKRGTCKIKIQNRRSSNGTTGSTSKTTSTNNTTAVKKEGTNTKSTITTKTNIHHKNQHEKKTSIVSSLSSLTLLTTLGYSIYTRKWREGHLVDVPSVNESDFYIGSNDSYNIEKNHNYSKEGNKLRRDLLVLEKDVARNGLMGKFDSVKDELEKIRSWHQKHGYRGGIVLRELNLPLYNPKNDEKNIEGGDDVETIPPSSSRSQRECYYLYYEIKPNGHTLHQIFCRGTTISEDVYTCLQSRLVYDDELGIHVHSGFRDHANRLVKDVVPLLGPTNTVRSTVEVSGHSLGGAVSFLVAMKLKKRGYNVTKVTAVAGARFCDPNDVKIANDLLPRDSLRIEDDLDAVPFLPPWASSVGDKLWLVNDYHNKANDPSSLLRYEPKYIQREILLNQDHSLDWVDNCWTNIRLPEILSAVSSTHRIISHKLKIQDLTKRFKDDENSRNIIKSQLPLVQKPIEEG